MQKRRIPNTKKIYMLSQKLGVTIEYLLTGNATNKYTNEEQRIIDAYNHADKITQGNINSILKIENNTNDKIKSSTFKTN